MAATISGDTGYQEAKVSIMESYVNSIVDGDEVMVDHYEVQLSEKWADIIGDWIAQSNNLYRECRRQFALAALGGISDLYEHGGRLESCLSRYLDVAPKFEVMIAQVKDWGHADLIDAEDFHGAYEKVERASEYLRTNWPRYDAPIPVEVTEVTGMWVCSDGEGGHVAFLGDGDMTKSEMNEAIREAVNQRRLRNGYHGTQNGEENG